MSVTLQANAVMTDDEALAYCKLASDLADAQQDIVRSIINAVSDLAEQWCNRPFASQAIDERYDGNGRYELYLRRLPVISITSIEYRGWDDAVITTYTSADFLLDSASGLLRFIGPAANFVAGRLNWRARYTAGFATIPAPIVQGAKMLVARAWRDYDQKRDDIDSVTFEGQTTTFVRGTIPEKVKGLWAPYRVPHGV